MDSDQNEHSSGEQSSQDCHRPRPDQTQLLSSAKVVAQTAKSAFRHENFDKAAAAGATSDLLDAASHYTKIEDGKYGEYVEKAKGYLNQYGASSQSSHSSTAAADSSPTKSSGEAQAEGEGEGEGGVDFTKMAQGFMNKQSTEDSSDENNSGGGIGGYMKMAQGFLK